MKKILLSVCFAVGALTCFAQSDNPPVSFGIKGGVNFSTLQQSASGSSSTTASGSLTTFHAGVFADFRVSDAFSVQPQLLYTGKGGSNKDNESADGFSASDNVKLSLYYLHLPVYALYHAPVGDNDFFIGAGPFISYGLSGNEKGSISISDIQTESGSTTETQNINQKVDFGSSDSTGVKRTDFGASVMAGFKLKNGFLISASYDLGLSNISPTADADVKTRVFSISVGYSF